MAEQELSREESSRLDDVASGHSPDKHKGKRNAEKNHKSKRALVSSIAAGKLFNKSALWKNVRQSLKQGSGAYEKMVNMVSPHLAKSIVKPVHDTTLVSSFRKSPRKGGDTPPEHMNLDNLSNQLLSDIRNEVPGLALILAENLANLQDLQHAQALTNSQPDAKSNMNRNYYNINDFNIVHPPPPPQTTTKNKTKPKATKNQT